MKTSTATVNGFLRRFRERDRESWQRFIACYVPYVYDLCRRNGCTGDLARQLTEETIRDVCHEVKTQRLDANNRSMLGWLETIVCHRLGESGIMQVTHDRIREGAGQGATQTMAMPQVQKSSPVQSLGIISRSALKLIEPEFEAREREAFSRVVINREPIGQVAASMNEPTSWVCDVRYRMLSRLREFIQER